MRFTRRAALLAVSLSVLPIAGCHENSSGAGQTSLSSSNPVATVNGVEISQGDFYNQLQSYRPNQATIGLPVGQTVLRQLINGILVVQLAQQQNVSPTDAQVSAIYNTQAAVANVQSVKPFTDLLAENGFTPDDVKNFQIKPQLATINLIEKGQPPITSAQVADYYNKNVNTQFTEPDRAHIKRIVVQSAADAQRIYKQIQAGSAFSTFVSQSLDHTYPGGDVPYWIDLDHAPNPQLAPPGLVPAMKKVAPGTTAASVIAPYSADGVYWIVQVLDKEPKQVVPLSQVSDFIQFSMEAQRLRSNPGGAQALQQELAKFQSSATITISDPRYAQMLNALKAPPPPAPALSAPGAPSSPLK